MTTVKLDINNSEFFNNPVINKNSQQNSQEIILGQKSTEGVKPLGAKEAADLEIKIRDGEVEKLGELENDRRAIAIYKIDGVIYYQVRHIDTNQVEYYPNEPYSFNLKDASQDYTLPKKPSNQNGALFNQLPPGVLLEKNI